MAAGLLLGGFMQPHLDEGDRPAGPQMFAGWAGTRSTGPFDPGTTFVGYQSPAPDYVMGTDAKKAMGWPEERAAVSRPAAELASNDDPPPDATPELMRATYDEPPTPAHDYPSLGGPQAATGQYVDAAEEAAPAIEG